MCAWLIGRPVAGSAGVSPALRHHGFDTIAFPRSRRRAGAVVAELVAELGDSAFLLPIIESARGALNAFAIASAAPTVVALAIGLEDYTADIGAQRTSGGARASGRAAR